MPISHEHKLIYIHIPKTGGVSICNALGIPLDIPHLFAEDKDRRLAHLTAHELRDELGPQIYNQYRKFTTVRNPFDRLVSSYHYQLTYSGSEPDDRIIDARGKTFEKYVLEVIQIDPYEHTQAAGCLFKHQLDFVEDDETIKIFRYEDRKPLDKFIYDYTGDEIPHDNKTEHEHWTTYYTEALWDLVNDYYLEDFEFFGY